MAQQGDKKSVYKARVSMAGVEAGGFFEADDDDPRVLSGRVEKVKQADVPDEVKAAFAEGAEAAPAPAYEPPVAGSTPRRQSGR